MRPLQKLATLLLSALSCLLSLTGQPRAAAQTVVSIHDIMVASATTADTKYFLPDSPYLYSHYGAPVSVTGVVVGVMTTSDGFNGTVYISEPASCTGSSTTNCWDSLVATAEGMPVYNLKALNSACAVVGASITVVGDVINSNAIVSSAITAANTPGTGLQPTSCTVNSTGNTMTQSISLGSTLNSFGGALEYTGMTTTATFYAISPAGSTTATTGTVSSNGQFWATLSSNTSTNSHLFRSAGIAKDEYVPSTAPSTVATWAGNPQRIVIDTSTFGYPTFNGTANTPVDLTVGQTITCTVPSGIKVGATAGIGLIDYTYGYARLLIFPTSVCTSGGSVATSTTATADSTHFHVGTLDLNNFSAANVNFTTRLPKAAAAISSALGMPDIVSLQEVSDLATLTSLASATSSKYQPYLTSGATDGLNLGFLVNTSTVTVDSVTQVQASSTYTTTSGGSATLWEHPPLVLKAEFVRVGKNYPVTVIDTHLTARDNIGDATLGPDIRAHRAAQAAALSALVQSYQSAGQNVVVAGNLNAFQFSDGYVDVTGVIDGSPAAASAVTLYQASSTTAALTDFATSSYVSTTSLYNYIERGDAVVYEHILASATVPDSSTASASLASYETSVTQPHFTTDFAVTDANSSSTPAGLGPHDGFVVAFLIPPVPTTASISASALNFGSLDIGASSSLPLTVTNTTTFTSTVNITNIAISGTNAGDFSQTSSCTSLAEGATCTVTVTFTPTAAGNRTATLTVTNDSTSDPTLTVSLTGTGLDTTATLTPASYTFPSTSVTATSAAAVFTFTNTSQIAETISAAPTVSGDFAISANTCTAGASIAASGTCTISVTFTPTAVGTRTGTLTLTDSSTGNPTLSASLTGTSLPTTATLSPTTADFGSVYAGGGTSTAKTFTVTNTSATAISISGITVAGNFAITANTCSGSLATSATCTIAVDFAPLTAGALTGTLTVTDTSSANPTLTATLTGTGLPTTAILSPTSSAYGTQIVASTSATHAFTWTNTSSIALTVSKLSTTGDFAVSSSTCATVAANSSCLIYVTFTPTALGARTGTLTVASSASANPTLTATLTGTGVADVQADVAALNFGNVDLGSTSSAQTLTITNYTNASIALTSFAITGDYAYASNCGALIAGLSSCTVSITFTPTALGARSGTFTINTNDTKYPVITVALTGNGVDFSVVVNPTSGSLIAGYNTQVTLTVTPLGGFSGSVGVGCTTNATGSTCAPQSSGIIPLTAVTTDTANIYTTSQYTVIGYTAFGLGDRWTLLLFAATAGSLAFALRRRKLLPRLLAAVLLLFAISTFTTGCSSKLPARNSDPTYPGTYTYTFSVSDGTLTRTATYTLTVTAK